MRRSCLLLTLRKLAAIAQASEFRELRFKNGEKAMYKNLNKSPSIRFSIPVDLGQACHKVSLLIQATLGAADVLWDAQTSKHKQQYSMDVNTIFKHVKRLVRCIIDCQIFHEDAVAIRNALMVGRSLGGRAWDDSPLQMKQIEQLGIISVRKLVNADIRTIEDLESTEAFRIETILGKNPPFGNRLLERLKSFPKLRVSAKLVPNSVCQLYCLTANANL